MRFREHRGTIEDSLDTLVELPDRDALVKHLITIWGELLKLSPAIDFGKVVVSPYRKSYDHRSDWAQTYIVAVPGVGPVGYTDSAV